MSLSWGLGAALTAWSVWLLGWLGLPLTVTTVGGALLTMAAVALLAARRARHASAATGGTAAAAAPSCAEHAPRDEAPWQRAVVLLLLAGVAALAIVTAALSIRNGARASDANSIWLLKARVVFIDGGFDGSYWRFWPDGHDRRGYPPLISLLGTWIYLLAGRADDGLVKLCAVSFHVALLALVYDVIARRLPRWAAALATLFFALVGMTVVLTVWGVADLPLAFFLLAALHAAKEDSRRGATVAGLLLAAAAFTKLEGIVAAPLAALAAGVSLGESSRALRVLRLGLPATIVALLWAHFTHQRGIPLLVGPSAALPDGGQDLAARFGSAASGLGASALRPGWLFAWLLFVLALARLASGRAPAGLRPWALFVLGLLAVDAFVLALQAGNLPWLIATTGTRLLYQAFPVAFAVTVIGLGGVSSSARTSRGPGA